ncbi:MAG: histidine phosphatase family protein [Lactobacillaceae bacterium]|jgi:probable phosphoglycerate mutase|nr:histidine phosphatase family protein [Lactobacillaceae bacterium]
MKKPLNLYVVRHGQTYFNLFKRFQGWSDIELTENGKSDGIKAGTRLANIDFANVYSSDLSRAYDTAKFILQENNFASSQTPEKLRDFREVFFGSFEGLPSDETIYKIDPEITENRAYDAIINKYGSDEVLDLMKEKDPFHLAENASEVWERVNRGINYIKDKNSDGGNILLVVHGTIIRGFGAKYGKKELSTSPIGNGAISKFIVKDNDIIIDTFNDLKTIW